MPTSSTSPTSPTSLNGTIVETAVTSISISEYPLFTRGKVRDVYDLGDSLLFITSDRLSAFDVVLPDGVPGKGRILTAMSLFWFEFLAEIIPSHVVTANVSEYPVELQKYRNILDGRSMIVRKARRIDIECVVRGYISGSLWKDLLESRGKGENFVHGFEFSADIRESEKLPTVLFTPAIKNDSGHDENISFAAMEKLIGANLADRLRDVSIALYSKAAAYALSRGIIIADTKFEFGFWGDQLILIDEALSPDSSRFWPLAHYTPGATQPSYDKQIVRNYLLTLPWEKTAPGPSLPPEIIAQTIDKYQEIKRLLIEPATPTEKNTK